MAPLAVVEKSAVVSNAMAMFCPYAGVTKIVRVALVAAEGVVSQKNCKISLAAMPDHVVKAVSWFLLCDVNVGFSVPTIELRLAPSVE